MNSLIDLIILALLNLLHASKNETARGTLHTVTHTYCRVIFDRDQTESQRSRYLKTFRSQVKQEIQRSRDKRKHKTHNQLVYNKSTKSRRTYTSLFALRALYIWIQLYLEPQIIIILTMLELSLAYSGAVTGWALPLIIILAAPRDQLMMCPAIVQKIEKQPSLRRHQCAHSGDGYVITIILINLSCICQYKSITICPKVQSASQTVHQEVMLIMLSM